MTTEYITGAIEGMLLYANAGRSIDVTVKRETITDKVTLHLNYWPHEKDFTFYVFLDDTVKSVRDALECCLSDIEKWIEKL